MPHERLRRWTGRVDAHLDEWLNEEACASPRLLAAMRHAVLGGGKRLRPLLVYAAGNAFGAADSVLDHAAVAVELVHAYSLVHDDLPAMDDDVLRRGKPTVHVAFDEATAILAGDALQTLAFEVLSRAPLDAAARVEMIRRLAVASGAAGMAGGQSLDLEATGTEQSLAALQRLHRHKTGALIAVSLVLGACAAGADASVLQRIDAVGFELGLAFQIRDDLLDVEGDPLALGKTAGKDAAQQKSTWPALAGIDSSRRQLALLSNSMHQGLADLGVDTAVLSELARRAVERDR